MTTREEFAAQRKGVLERADTALLPVVRSALEHWAPKSDWWTSILAAAEPIFSDSYRDITGKEPDAKRADGLKEALGAALSFTEKPNDNTAEVVARLVASAAVNAGTEAGAEDHEDDLDLEWITMHDRAVRETHRAADGQTRKVGEPFHIGESELDYPGDPKGRLEDWIGCRCILRPTASGSHSLTASAGNAQANTSTVIVALPAANDGVHSMGPEDAHCTLVWLGQSADVDPTQILPQLAQIAEAHQPATEGVSGRAELGADKAQVLLLDANGLASIRQDMMGVPYISETNASADTHPTWIPHTTLGYPGQGDISQDNPDSITFDRLALWHGDDQTEFPLGVPMTAPTDQIPTAEATAAPTNIPWHGVMVMEGAPTGDGRRFAHGSLRNRDLPLPLSYQEMSAEGHSQAHVVGMIHGLQRIDNGDGTATVRGHGVFRQTPESDRAIGAVADFGKYGVSIDADDATMEYDDENDAVNFTDARISGACLVNIPAFAEAYICLGEAPWLTDDQQMSLHCANADTNGSLLAKSGSQGSGGVLALAGCEVGTAQGPDSPASLRGDLDRSTSRREAAEGAQGGLGGAARVNSERDDDRSSMSEQALSERGTPGARDGSGEHAANVGDQRADTGVSTGTPEKYMAGAEASAARWVDNNISVLPRVSQGATTQASGRGPGWVTDPDATRRIHDYWVVPGQPGYEKIGWGTPGDFNRCRAEVGKYLTASGEPEFVNQTCAVWHRDALGIWPATHAKELKGGLAAENMISLVASAAVKMWQPPADAFVDPQLDGPTRITYRETSEGTYVYGHLAEWRTCHTAVQGMCIVAPKTTINYADFLLSDIECSDGSMVKLGQLTLGTGHANQELSARDALAHYDNTGSAVADVTLGEDDHGIWFAGMLRPWVTARQKFELKAAKLSGDWREHGYCGPLELIAALAVNVPGFKVAVEAKSRNGHQLSLVAAGALEGDCEDMTDVLADVVAAGIQEYEARKQRVEQVQGMARDFGVDPASQLLALANEFATEEI